MKIDHESFIRMKKNEIDNVLIPLRIIVRLDGSTNRVGT